MRGYMRCEGSVRLWLHAMRGQCAAVAAGRTEPGREDGNTPNTIN